MVVSGGEDRRGSRKRLEESNRRSRCGMEWPEGNGVGQWQMTAKDKKSRGMRKDQWKKDREEDDRRREMEK